MADGETGRSRDALNWRLPSVEQLSSSTTVSIVGRLRFLLFRKLGPNDALTMSWSIPLSFPFCLSNLGQDVDRKDSSDGVRVPAEERFLFILLGVLRRNIVDDLVAAASC